MRIIEPSYYRDFKCVGDKCINHCCKGWNILIDKDSYTKYTEKKDEFGKILNSGIKVKDKEEAYGYGEVILNNKGECPFLNEEKLCNIYINYGEDYMCNTCKIYPRKIEKYNEDLYQRTLNLSCPEIIKYLINTKDKMSFIIDDVNLSTLEEKNISKVKDCELDYLNFILETRSLLIDIAQLREIPLWQRIAMINSVSENVQEIIGCYNNWEQKLEMVKEAIVSEEYINLLKAFDNVDILKRMKFLKSFLEKKVNENLYYKELVIDISYFIKNTSEIGIEGALEEEKEFKLYFEKFNYIMENYIVSLLFSEIPKVLNSNNIIAEVSIIMASYTAIMTQLYCIWDKRLELKDNDFKNVIHNFSRITVHNQKALYNLIVALEKEGFGRNELVSILYKI